MPTPSIEERLSALESDADENAERDTKLKLMTWAQIQTLAQFAEEVATREGIGVEQFQQRFLAAFHWHHARRLERAEEIDASFAARIDSRQASDVSTDERPPSIFPQKAP